MKNNPIEAKTESLEQELDQEDNQEGYQKDNTEEDVLIEEIKTIKLNIKKYLEKIKNLLELQSIGSISQSSKFTAEEIEECSTLSIKKIIEQKNKLINSLHNSFCYNIEETKEKIEQLKKTKGIKKISSLFKIKKLEEQLASLELELEKVDNEISSKQSEIDRLISKKTLIETEQDDMLFSEISQEIERIQEGYKKIIQNISQDKTIEIDVYSTYISEVILKEIEKKSEQDETLREKYNELVKLFDEYTQQENEEKEIILEKIEEIMSKYFCYESNYLGMLKQKKPEEIIGDLIEKMIGADLGYIIEEASKTNSRIETKISKSINSVGRSLLRESKYHTFSEFYDLLGSRVWLETEYPDKLSNHYEMSVWASTMHSKKLNEVFGDTIKNQHQRTNKALLEKSLLDKEGGVIDNLYYYPTPDAVRNLVMIAYAEYDNYRTLHANITLSRLSKKTNWKEILDETEKKYPYLKSIRPVLESWDYKDYGSNPEIGNVPEIEKEALSILEDESSDGGLLLLAKESVNNESLVEILSKKGVVNKSTIVKINDASKIIKETLGEHDDAISKKLRDILRSFVKIEEDDKNEKTSKLENLEIFSSYITNNKTSLIEQISISEVVEKITQDFFKKEDVLKIIEKMDIVFDFIVRNKENKTLTQFTKFNSEIIQEILSNTSTNENLLTLIKKLETLFDFIGKNQDDLSLMTYLSPVMHEVLQRSFKIEKIPTILESYKHFSSISDETIQELELNNNPSWDIILAAYIKAETKFLLSGLSADSIKKIRELFQKNEIKNICLEGFRKAWALFLKSENKKEQTDPIEIMSFFINRFGNIDQLSQINSLHEFITTILNSFSKGTTAERTKTETMDGLSLMEDRFKKEKWSNEDITFFYNISENISKAAPSLFSEYLKLFEKLSPSELKQFTKEIYPLYRTSLVLMEKNGTQEKENSHNISELLEMRKDIKDFSNNLNYGKTSFETKKEQLLEKIKSLFKNKFGIIKTPESFDSENIRSIINMSLYLSNIEERTPKKENILGFYLSLMINGKWDNFRNGEQIDAREFLTQEKALEINNLLAERKRLSPLNAENLGIPEEDVAEFTKTLQQETSNIVIGNIETVDIKLMNIALNLSGLEDPDLYTDKLDKERMRILLKYGNKKIGSVVAKIFQELSGNSKNIIFTEEDEQIKKEIIEILKNQNIELTKENLKENFQDGIRLLSIVANILNFIKETNLESEVEKLTKDLKPSSEIIKIFKKLGEDFSTESGAIAISQDLNYLESLIDKSEDELEPNEKELVKNYINQIKSRVIKLEELYTQIKNRFNNLKQSISGKNNPLLQDKLEQIDKIISTESTQQAITSTATNNFNIIIENIRECLSCTKQGCNNDTDLTFGNTNKFYLYSQTETKEKGSISDEILFMEKIKTNNGSSSVAFILDRIYGTSIPTILENQIEAVLKKQRILKEKFPHSKISTFISTAAIKTGGTSTELLLEKLRSKNILATKETVEVDISESATGDHYIEFGGDARKNGKRNVDGLLIL